jgi:predicted GNAT family acetyltransferase
MAADNVETLEITDNRERRRWEVLSNSDVIAYAEYRAAPGRIVFTHTIVDPAFEGRGIGSRLAETVLDDAVRRGLRITPLCPFIRAYLERHPQYAAAVDLPAAGSAAP